MVVSRKFKLDSQENKTINTEVMVLGKSEDMKETKIKVERNSKLDFGKMCLAKELGSIAHIQSTTRSDLTVIARKGFPRSTFCGNL